MELRHLRYFCAVAEALNFTRAAEKLRVAQPALSRQVQALEAELGTRLLDRNRQRVLLTDAGRLFFSHAQKILAQVDLAVLSVRDVSTGDGGELRLGHDWRLPASLVSMAIAEYRRQYPRVEVDVRDQPMTEQLAALHNRKIHIGFIAAALLGPDPQLVALPFFHTDTIAIVPTDHPLATRQTIRLIELRQEEWICIETRDNGYRSFIQQTCRNAGFTPRFSRVGSAQPGAIVGLVAAGMGIAILPRAALPPNPQGLAVLGTDCDPLDICAVWNRHDTSPLMRNFVVVLKSLAMDTPRQADPAGT